MKTDRRNCDSFLECPNYLIVDFNVVRRRLNRLKLVDVERKRHEVFDQVHQLDFEFFIRVSENVHKQECVIHFDGRRRI